MTVDELREFLGRLTEKVAGFDVTIRDPGAIVPLCAIDVDEGAGELVFTNGNTVRAREWCDHRLAYRVVPGPVDAGWAVDWLRVSQWVALRVTFSGEDPDFLTLGQSWSPAYERVWFCPDCGMSVRHGERPSGKAAG